MLIQFGALAVVVGALGYFAAMFAAVNAWNRLWREQRSAITANEKGLFVDGRLFVRRSQLRHGHVLRRGDKTFVRLGRTYRLVEVEVANEEAGHALLRAMRLDSAHSVGDYGLMHGTYASSWRRSGLVGGFAALVLPFLVYLAGPMFGVVVALAAVVSIVMWAFSEKANVYVGADGVHIRRFLVRPRFVAFEDIASVKKDDRNVTILLRDGGKIEMHQPARPGAKVWGAFFADRADEARLMVERIAEGAARAPEGITAAARLARGTRTTREWLRDLGRATDEHASFRDAALPDEQLWRVVEDPSAAPTARAGAAVALRGRLDDHSKARLRVVADACAGPKLRVALEAVAGDLALEESLEALEDPSERRLTR